MIPDKLDASRNVDAGDAGGAGGVDANGVGAAAKNLCKYTGYGCRGGGEYAQKYAKQILHFFR